MPGSLSPRSSRHRKEPLLLASLPVESGSFVPLIPSPKEDSLKTAPQGSVDRKIIPVLGLSEGDFIIALLVSNARCLGAQEVLQAEENGAHVIPALRK